MEINLWTMIIILVLIAAVTSTIQAFIARGSGKPARREDETDTRMLTDEVRVLRERVAVLERIATERNHSLEHEIERLRDR